MVEPSEETGFEDGGVGIDRVREIGGGVGLMFGEVFEDGDEAVVGCAFDSHDVDDLAVLAGGVVYGGEVLAGAGGDRLGICELSEVEGGESTTIRMEVVWRSFHTIVSEGGGRVLLVVIICCSEE